MHTLFITIVIVAVVVVMSHVAIKTKYKKLLQTCYVVSHCLWFIDPSFFPYHLSEGSL
jgi:hypothetical protein